MANSQPPDFDAVIVGAGFAGLYMLHSLRDKLGLSVRACETGSGVGGTW
jgi:cation diffusion facilitator CzcD-associated flavoprotein CzcO